MTAASDDAERDNRHPSYLFHKYQTRLPLDAAISCSGTYADNIGTPAPSASPRLPWSQPMSLCPLRAPLHLLLFCCWTRRGGAKGAER